MGVGIKVNIINTLMFEENKGVLKEKANLAWLQA
jgi:hypothetical protein